jgi:hypothetical protein
MHASPFPRFLRRFLFIWILAIIVIGLLLVVFISPLSPFHPGSRVGCQDTVRLILTHETLAQDTLALMNTSGETRNGTCSPGKVSCSQGSSVLCRVGIVSSMPILPARCR